MKILGDIGINLLAALIGFCIGWLWKWFRLRIRFRRARAFWKPFVKGGLQIVLGRFSEFSSFEQSGLIGVGDASALMELLTFFDALGLRGVRVTYADRLDGDDLKTNLVLLGGPDANLITNEAVKRIPTTLQFGDPSINQISIHD